MDLRGIRANIHLHFSKLQWAGIFPFYYRLKRGKKRNALMDKSETIAYTNSINFALLRFTHSPCYEKSPQIKTDITGNRCNWYIGSPARHCQAHLHNHFPWLLFFFWDSIGHCKNLPTLFHLSLKERSAKEMWSIWTDFIKQLNPSLPA